MPFLPSVPVPDFLSNSNNADISNLGVIWDAGLGYKTVKDTFATTCVPAAQALMLYYAIHDDSLPPLSTATVHSLLFFIFSSLVRLCVAVGP